jgi:hypothetical protein
VEYSPTNSANTHIQRDHVNACIIRIVRLSEYSLLQTRWSYIFLLLFSLSGYVMVQNGMGT